MKIHKIKYFSFIYKEGEFYEPIIYLDQTEKDKTNKISSNFTFDNLKKLLNIPSLDSFIYRYLSQNMNYLDDSNDFILDIILNDIKSDKYHFIVNNDNKISYIIDENNSKIIPLNVDFTNIIPLKKNGSLYDLIRKYPLLIMKNILIT